MKIDYDGAKNAQFRIGHGGQYDTMRVRAGEEGINAFFKENPKYTHCYIECRDWRISYTPEHVARVKVGEKLVDISSKEYGEGTQIVNEYRDETVPSRTLLTSFQDGFQVKVENDGTILTQDGNYIAEVDNFWIDNIIDAVKDVIDKG